MIWTELTEHTGYFKTPFSLVPYYKLNDRELVLLDSGEKIFPELIEDIRNRNQTVRAVINSHLHFDHQMNNEILQKNFGCEIFSTEAARHNQPDTGIVFTQELIPEGDTFLDIDGSRFEILDLPGHCPGHVGIVTPDHVCYLSDALMSKRQIQLAKLPYKDQPLRFMLDCDRVRELDYPLFIMAHKGYCRQEELEETIRLNERKDLEIYERLLKLSGTPVREKYLILDCMKDQGIDRMKFLESPVMQHTLRVRIEALLRLGCMEMDDEKLVSRGKWNRESLYSLIHERHLTEL